MKMCASGFAIIFVALSLCLPLFAECVRDTEQDCVDQLHHAVSKVVTPKCFDEEKVISAKGLPENTIKKMMSNLDDREIFVRLILAESYASGCPDLNVAKSIAWVLANRVAAKDATRYGLGRDVVFKPYQFRSSTGGCDVAKRSVFLCPSSLGKDWNKAWAMANEAYDHSQESAKNPIEKSYQYFFYKHFDHSVNCKKWKGVIPSWANAKKRITPKGFSLNSSCMAVFK